MRPCVMRPLGILFSLVIVVASNFGASASEEADVDWREVRIVSAHYKKAGTIVLDVKTDGQDYRSVSLQVFGKQFALGEKELLLLKGLPLNSLRISQEGSYAELGGYAVIFKLRRISYESGKLLEKRVLIWVSEGKGLQVFDWGTRELPQRSSPPKK